MRIRTILYGILLFLALEVWTTILPIVELERPDLFLLYLQISPWMMFGSVLLLAVLAVVVPWEWLEEL